AKQPWIRNISFDTAFILSPAWIGVLFVLLFPTICNENQQGISEFWWLMLVLFIDVSHVYSTLFRTYFDKRTYRKFLSYYTLIPILGFIAGITLYSIDGLLFWRVMAYLAVFHFIRQQYGFFMIYCRFEKSTSIERLIDKITIYAATLIPLLIWHLKGETNFNWFVAKDFLYFHEPTFIPWVNSIYTLLLIIFLIKEIKFVIHHRAVNLPKYFFLAGTIISWYLGIVLLDGDLSFTLLNVVAHGIPYMALVWHAGNRNKDTLSAQWVKFALTPNYFFLFLFIILGLGFLEEGLWNSLIWQDHNTIFQFSHLIEPVRNEMWLSILVPLLTLPQLTHYLLDGFIWKSKDRDKDWNKAIHKD
ncbi:MAG TPA: hypothetical protein PLU10_05245, partial [Chitinophagaceae bacterium]|nr:hypothetical protein [Chitinophagaceae bacterium]